MMAEDAAGTGQHLTIVLWIANILKSWTARHQSEPGSINPAERSKSPVSNSGRPTTPE